MKTTASLEEIIDPFVRSVGGERVSDIVGNSNPPPNADYLFQRHNVIAELKTLQKGSFGPSFRNKLGTVWGDLSRRGRPIVYGRRCLNSNELSSECQKDMFDIMAAPLQHHVISDANGQIGNTKSLLNLAGAKGLLWVASDGNTDLPPNLVWFLLTRILQKKQDGRQSYSNINGLAYFNPRMLAHVPGVDRPTFFWFSGSRPKDDPQVTACLSELFPAWFNYLKAAYGVAIQQLGMDAVSPQDVGFWGVPPSVPFIHVNYTR